MKVLLVQPLGNLDEPGRYIRNCYVEPIGLEYIATILLQDGHEVIMVHPLKNEQDFQETIRDFNPDIIGYSVYTYAYPIALKWARLAKKTYKDVINIFGGYHPTAFPDTVKEPAIDYAMIGEGEIPVRQLLSALKQGEPLDDISGVAYVRGNTCKMNPVVRNSSLDLLPYPLRDKNMLKYTKSYQLSCPPPSEQVSVAQVVYSRGCPYSCIFCSNENMWGTNVYWRNPKNVVDEIQFLHEKYGTNLIFFTDLTFNLYKEKIHTLCEELQKKDLPVHWWAMCRVDHLDESLLIHMREAKCSKITVGLETTEKCFHKQVKALKFPNGASLDENLQLAWSLGLIVRGTFMIGYPWADSKYYEDFLENLLSLYLDEIRISFYTPLPGTKLYEISVSESLLATKNFSDYTTDKPILKNRFFDSSELLNLRERMISDFYLNELYERRSMDKIERHPWLKKPFLEFFEFLADKNIVEDATIFDHFSDLVASASAQNGFPS